ncbi:MAG: DUF1249 domain-containing protein [Steroidobacteraceae bacterium]|nr:DUF1249 domain-containing protein [Steroidobacteraceae bacterium]
MLDDAITLVSWRSRPRSFVALMALYESNFLRLSWLAGNLATLGGRHRSVVPGDCDLLLTVTERSPYTTTLQLTYQLGSLGELAVPGAAQADPAQYPDMSVRIYHDAHLVEAQEWAGSHPHSVLQALRRRVERELDQRWARNVMLNKWLEYCLERGHRFSPATLIAA